MDHLENTPAIHSLLAQRKSIRAFSPESIEPGQLHKLFEAAGWAPSAMNEQPWLYLYATKENRTAFASLLSCLYPANQVWAKEAAALILSLAKINYTGNQQPNNHAWYDVGAANMALSLQATAEGLYVHQMGGFDANKVVEIISVPEEYKPVTVLAIGYKGDPNNLPDALKERELAPRHRKPVEAFAIELK